MTEVTKKQQKQETPHDLYVEEQEVNIDEQLYNNSYCYHFLKEALKQIKIKEEK